MEATLTPTSSVTVLDSEEAAAAWRLIRAVYSSKVPVSATFRGVVVTRLRDVPGADDVTSLWRPEELIDPLDIFETVMQDTDAFQRRPDGTLVCVSTALVARVFGRVTEEAERLERAQALPAGGWRHYRRTRELPAKRRHVASLTQSFLAEHPYLNRPFDRDLRIPGGAMVLSILSVAPVGETQVEVLWDVAEGYYAGCYAQAPEHVRFLHRETINLGTKSAPATAYKIDALNRSNPGLDAYRLLTRGDWDGLRGRKFGAVFRMEDYPSKRTGAPAVRAKLREWIPVSEVPSTPAPEPYLQHGYTGELPAWPEGAKGWD